MEMFNYQYNISNCCMNSVGGLGINSSQANLYANYLIPPKLITMIMVLLSLSLCWFQEWHRLTEQEFFMRAKNAEAKWCRDNFLQRKTLHEVNKMKRCKWDGQQCLVYTVLARLQFFIFNDGRSHEFSMASGIGWVFWRD